ncbi:transposable element Tcb2 transposase [Trichonephila clavipes]|nr:transposable element Tcb2 transposase [Trichonephila clavipes]
MNHKKYRVAGCRKHLSWTQDDWKRVPFSDKLQFRLDIGVFIWRESGSRYRFYHYEKGPLYRSGVMAWKGIIAEGYTDLHMSDRGTLESQRYRDKILSPYIKLFHE